MTPGRTGSLPSIALVVPYLRSGGGIEATARFLSQAIEESGRYRAQVISLACSADDDCSVRVRAPSTWLRGVRVGSLAWHGRQVPHVGCFLAELEFQRYRPRRALTEMLDRHDLTQIVAGSPSWGLVARKSKRPVALQTAALAREERRLAQARSGGALGLWRSVMTRFTDRLDAAAVQRADAVFVINRRMQEWARRQVSSDSVVLAPQGIDTELFCPAKSSSLPGYLLSVGRFADPRKNVRLLFEAYRIVTVEVPDAPCLLLAGRSGPTDQDWRHAEELGIRSRVTFREGLGLGELARLYREAGLFVLTSDQEGLGIVIREAMASGLPVVSTDCVGPRTSVSDGATGFLVPNGDAAALADRIRTLISDTELAGRMGSAGRKAAVYNFSLEVAGRRYLERYDLLLAEREPRVTS